MHIPLDLESVLFLLSVRLHLQHSVHRMQRNQEATVYVGNLDEAVDEELIWELFIQVRNALLEGAHLRAMPASLRNGGSPQFLARPVTTLVIAVQVGPVASVHLPKDKISGKNSGFAFVEMKVENDAEYAIKILNLTKVYSKPIKINKASSDKNKIIDVGANLFIGNLDLSVDEKSLYDTFGAFGGITQHPHIMRDPATGASRGFGFVSFDSFDASDAAIEAMNGRFFGGRQIVVQYAYKKDSRTERHGSAAERMMAAAMQKTNLKPNMFFSSTPGQVTSAIPSNPAPMIGTSMAPPAMLPPAAILPSSMSAPSASYMMMPGGGGGGGGPHMGGMGMPMPPPLPHGFGMHGAHGGGGGMLPPPLPIGFGAPGAPFRGGGGGFMPPQSHMQMMMPGMGMPGMPMPGMGLGMGMGMPRVPPLPVMGFPRGFTGMPQR